jgi:hypothetical protein
MRIIVTGSRKLVNPHTVWDRLLLFAPGRPITLVVGYDPERQYPPGADEFAYQFAVDRWNWTPECFPAQWNTDCNHWNCTRRGFCWQAGFLRNQAMVDSGADFAIGFKKRKAKNNGTNDCLRRIIAAGIKSETVWEAA